MFCFAALCKARKFQSKQLHFIIFGLCRFTSLQGGDESAPAGQGQSKKGLSEQLSHSGNPEWL
jgi:hypothetical protein